MGDIKAFLQPPVMNETKEVIISQRFKDEKGNPVPFVIRAIDQETNDRLYSQSLKKVKSNGMIYRELDDNRYGKLLVNACVVTPNFKDAELCSYYKTANPLDVPGRMLTVGEYNALVFAIKELNGLVTSEDEFNELEEEAKNS